MSENVTRYYYSVLHYMIQSFMEAFRKVTITNKVNKISGYLRKNQLVIDLYNNEVRDKKTSMTNEAGPSWHKAS